MNRAGVRGQVWGASGLRCVLYALDEATCTPGSQFVTRPQVLGWLATRGRLYCTQICECIGLPKKSHRGRGRSWDLTRLWNYGIRKTVKHCRQIVLRNF